MISSYRHIFKLKNAWPILAISCFILSFIPVIFSSEKSMIRKEQTLLQEYVNKQERDFYLKTSNVSFINNLLNQAETFQEFEAIDKLKYGFYIVRHTSTEGQKIIFWNKQNIIPPDRCNKLSEGKFIMKLANGYYLLIKKNLPSKIKGEELMAIGLVPVFNDYYIETDYLFPGFAHKKNKNNQIAISFDKNEYPVKSLNGKVLFYLKTNAAANTKNIPLASFILRILALFILLGFIHKISEWVAIRRSNLYGIGLLALSLLVVQLVIYFIPSLLNLRQFELFDPSIYGYNFVLKSLGDLLINTSIFCWIILFTWSKYKDNVQLKEIKDSIRNKIVAAVLVLVLILFTLYLSGIIKSLVSDSKISFDVTNFFSLSVYTVVSFIILTSLALSYYYFSKMILQFVLKAFENNFVYVLFLIAIAGLFFFTIISNHHDLRFYIIVLIWILIFTTLIIREILSMSLNTVNLGSVIFWIFFFSLSISLVVLSENKIKEWSLRINIAEKMAMQTDPSSERLLSIALTYLDNNFLSENFSRFKNETKGRVLRDSIISENFAGYLNKYDTRLYVFNEKEEGLYNENLTSYNSLNTILQNQAKKTSVAGLYYYETSFDQFAYITKREVLDEDFQLLGTFFIISNPKKYRSDALFPVLFKQMKKNDPEETSVYSFALYNKKILVSPFNKYPFLNRLNDADLPKFEIEKRFRGNYDELWFRAGTDKVVVIARKQDTLIETLTLFSYIFCAFILIGVILQFASFLFRTRFNKASFLGLFKLNIRSQVYGTIIFISLFSFIIIGIATISFFIKRHNQNNSDKLSRSMRVMINEIQNKFDNQSVFNDAIKINDSVASFHLQQLVEDVSEIHNADINIYDLEGVLRVSSQPNIYAKGVLSINMNPKAYYHLSRLREIHLLQEEKVGELSYLSIYAPLRDNEGKVYAYLNIPYFSSQNDLNQEISNFLVTIINLNAFIFLIAGLLALLITNRITRTFSIISDKMKGINLGSINEEVEWNRDDEIGVLVKEYNKMVRKLEISAAELAKNEREFAWREMARQVAHEIKNPLTPMKLSIQYLQKAMKANQLNVRELTSNVVETLVEQIDHLSKIATDFSQFANIGIIKKERFDLQELLLLLKGLYSTNPKIDIAWYPLSHSVFINADKTQINRLFTNLLSNAVEACRYKPIGNINIDVEAIDKKVMVTIKDNGEGIPLDMHFKIFTPNFTTKSSGTGLGLAMCKTIVEQAQGKIWFESDSDKGATFFVELPLAD